jgi:hypothetical protein
MKQVDDMMIPALGSDLGGEIISEQCAQRWLVKLGYGVKEVWKEIVVDGHECANVVEYCKKFLTDFAKNERSATSVMA